ncbi:AAA domain-containing protein [Mycoplasma phocoeninasale]|uniref:AAA domain-containing protein n=1 Tax=Mycoplasma phocoeninasale TaxID=2726117 RepID=UPI001966DD8F|nr:ATP-binding protein [Mycoplasma phocoeninasale]
MENNEIKYQTILANLQNIETNDSSLFSSVDNEKFFDVMKNFGEETFENFYNNFRISHILKENSNRILTEKVAVAENKFEIISTFKEYNRRIDNPIFKALNTNFEKAKQMLLNNLETEFQKSIVKWKKILNNAKNINIETNIWPLHLGFFFISIKTDKKTIFAPLFFKEVTIRIENSLVYLESNAEIRVNSKLITFLGQQGFMINADTFNFANATIKEVFEYFKTIWSPIYQIPSSIKNPIPDLQQDEITNTSIEFHQGMVLGFYNVSSGYLWNQMKKIIENDEFDYILNPNISKVKYVETVKRVIFDKHFKLFKIQKTNFSQDCATISALYQDTIIWGPPGTGKSQTISNLIANIVAHGYSGLVVSQKKAALDVLKKRLKSISKFCLFALSDKHVQLDEFYKPLQKYVYELEHCSRSNSEKGISIFSIEDKSYVDTISRLHNNPNIDNLLQFYSALMNANFSETLFNNLKLLDRELKYAFDKVLLDKKSIMKYLYEMNLGKKPHFFTLYPSTIKHAAEILASDNSLFSVDIDKCLKYIDKVDYESVVEIIEEYKNIVKTKTVELNNEKILSEMILEKKYEIVSNFSGKQLALYNDFTLSIRTAKLKPYLFFHRYREIIKLLFPIIITTPEIDLSMWEKEEFDYAILDESSQMFLEKGIPILYLAKRKILAGDSQQMQPTRWFSVTYNFDEEDELGHIESLLAYARNRGVFSILLNKNYRSKLAALMTFSSKHFYDSKLDVIDDYEVSLNKDKAIDVIQVNGSWNNSMNVEEGTKVIEIIKENLKKYKKIIILVFNVKQQDYLMNLIFGNEPEIENAINSEQISLKNIENIQGDEADLVIMSVVYDKNTSLYGTYVARSGGKNALNVAISRAREKIIVVKSIYADDVQINENSTTDMRIFKEWLKFLDLSLEDQKNYLDQVDEDMIENTRNISLNLDLDYKKEILLQLQQLVLDNDNLKFIADYSIGTKTIDIVLINITTNKLIHGFIIDYYDYINNYENYLKFKDGIKFLESKAYPITIISKHEWPIQKNKIINDIKEKINNEIIVTKNYESDKIARQRPKVVIRSINDEIENDDEIDDFHVEENYNKEKSMAEDIEIEEEATKIIRLDLDIDNELELENQPKHHEVIDEDHDSNTIIPNHQNRNDLHEVEIESDETSKTHLKYDILDEDENIVNQNNSAVEEGLGEGNEAEANQTHEILSDSSSKIYQSSNVKIEDQYLTSDGINDRILENAEETEGHKNPEEASDLTDDIYYNTAFYDNDDESSEVSLENKDQENSNQNFDSRFNSNFEVDYVSEEFKNYGKHDIDNKDVDDISKHSITLIDSADQKSVDDFGNQTIEDESIRNFISGNELEYNENSLPLEDRNSFEMLNQQLSNNNEVQENQNHGSTNNEDKSHFVFSTSDEDKILDVIDDDQWASKDEMLNEDSGEMFDSLIHNASDSESEDNESEAEEIHDLGDLFKDNDDSEQKIKEIPLADESQENNSNYFDDNNNLTNDDNQNDESDAIEDHKKMELQKNNYQPELNVEEENSITSEESNNDHSPAELVSHQAQQSKTFSEKEGQNIEDHIYSDNDDLNDWIYSNDWDDEPDNNNTSMPEGQKTSHHNEDIEEQMMADKDVLSTEEKTENKNDNLESHEASEYLKEFNLMDNEESEDNTTEIEKYIGE